MLLHIYEDLDDDLLQDSMEILGYKWLDWNFKCLIVF